METKLLLKIADKFGTPTYVYDRNLIRENFRKVKNAFVRRYKNSKILYAYKANTNLAICRLLKKEGAGADVVSGGELYTALKVGVNRNHILFTSNSKTDNELKMAVDSGITVNVDSVDELKILNEIAKKKRKIVKISFRINPNVSPKTHLKISTGLKESKFGIHIDKGLAINAYKIASEMSNVKIVGIHTHIGSQLTDTIATEIASKKIMDFVYQLKKKLGIVLNFIDLGGGFGISYYGKKIIQVDDFASKIIPIFRAGCKKLNYYPELWVEPGRYIVAESGVLLTRVNNVKETPYKKFVNVDAGFNTLIRPAMYGSYHRVIVVNKINKESIKKYDIAGNICESGDILAKDRKLPRVEKNDIVAFLDAGAYGFSMASQYNSQPLPAEALVRGNKIDLIRKRGTYKDLYLNQKVPKGP